MLSVRIQHPEPFFFLVFRAVGRAESPTVSESVSGFEGHLPTLIATAPSLLAHALLLLVDEAVPVVADQQPEFG